MKLFKIKRDTPVRAVKSRTEWYPANMVDTVTKKDNLFELEDMIVDPLKAGQYPLTIGDSYAKAGWYGFEKDGWVMLVSGVHVEVM